MDLRTLTVALRRIGTGSWCTRRPARQSGQHVLVLDRQLRLPVSLYLGYGDRVMEVDVDVWKLGAVATEEGDKLAYDFPEIEDLAWIGWIGCWDLDFDPT